MQPMHSQADLQGVVLQQKAPPSVIWTSGTVAGAVNEILSPTEKSVQVFKNSLYKYGFLCCCKREYQRFELEVTNERIVNVTTDIIPGGCCSGDSISVEYATVYLPHIVGMKTSKFSVGDACCGSLCKCDCEASCCNPNEPADWVHIHSSNPNLDIRSFMPRETFPQIRVHVASVKAAPSPVRMA